MDREVIPFADTETEGTGAMKGGIQITSAAMAKRLGCLLISFLLWILVVGCAPGTNQRSSDGFSFVKVAIGGWGRVVAVDSEGGIWETDPYRDKEIPYADRVYSSDPSTWENVVDASVGCRYLLALFEDGTVRYDNLPLDKRMIVGTERENEPYPLFDLSEWEDIKAVSCSADLGHAVGLHDNGTVVAAPYGEFRGADQIQTWKNIVAVAVGQDTIFGLRSDGTVFATSYAYLESRLSDFHATIDDWTDIIVIDAGMRIVGGLRSDGTVVIGGAFGDGVGEIATWKNITDIAVCNKITVGLTEQGTVRLAYNSANSASSVEEFKRLDDLRQQVESWTDVVAIDALDNTYAVAGLKSDGTILLAVNEGDQDDQEIKKQIEEWNEHVTHE